MTSIATTDATGLHIRPEEAGPRSAAVLNCGHVVSFPIPAGQLQLHFPGSVWTCLACFRAHGFEGNRYLVRLD